MAFSAVFDSPRPPSARSVESVDSEYECELMIEALRRELSAVRSQLAFLTHNLDVSSLPYNQEPPTTEQSPTPPSHSPTTLVTHKVKPTRTTPKKVVKQDVVSEARGMREVGRYLEVVDEVEGRRWEMRKRCLQLMQTHIEQQLQCLKERGEQLRRRLLRRQNKARAERLKLKPPRYRSLGKDDTAFLENLPQSTFYQIVGEEHRLRKSGKLKSLSEIRDFWDFMLSPIEEPTPSPPPMATQYKQHPLTPDEDEDDTSNSWAITALPPERPLWRQSPHPSPLLHGTQTSTPPHSNDLFKFVPGKLPTMKPIADLLNQGMSAIDDEKREAECLYRVQELTIQRKKLQNMYQQARANEMVMRRLLPRLPTFDHSPLPETDDVIMTSSSSPEVGEETHLALPEISHASLREPPSEEIPTATGVHTEHSTESEERISDASGSTQSMSSDEASSPVAPPLIPLTMESAAEQSTLIMEPKRKSALWSNYLLAGRSSS